MALATATEALRDFQGCKPQRHGVGKRTSGRRSLSSPSRPAVAPNTSRSWCSVVWTRRRVHDRGRLRGRPLLPSPRVPRCVWIYVYVCMCICVVRVHLSGLVWSGVPGLDRSVGMCVYVCMYV